MDACTGWEPVVSRVTIMFMPIARELWLRIETIHAVTYFAAESTEASTRAGLDGFWAGYFGFRAAPLGAVGAGAVEASFFNFAPSFVQRWVPNVWSSATPDTLVAARSQSAVAALARVVPDVAAAAAVRANPLLQNVVDTAIAAGRPLFAANRLLPLPDEPVARLWQLCTSLREHRGDGLVAALTAAGLDGLEANVLIALEQGNSPTDLQRTRGWTADDWTAADARLTHRGLCDAGGLTVAGRALRSDVEATTDRLAVTPFEATAGDFGAQIIELLELLDPVARAISASGVIRYPNPMGLPALT